MSGSHTGATGRGFPWPAAWSAAYCTTTGGMPALGS
jgi:hypothetical protein